MFLISKSNLPEVTSNNLYLDKDCTKVDQSGLLSEVIFGPIESYKCSCNKYASKNLYGGEVCPECGVICDSNDLRYSKFGKITLPLPIIKSVNKNKFFKLVTKKYKNFLNPNQFDLISTLNIYMFHDHSQDLLYFTDSYSASCVPIKITGFYSLYLALKSIENYSETAKQYLESFYTELLVIPPECRLTLNLKETSRKLIKHKIVDLYIEIIRLKDYVYKGNPNINDDIDSHHKKIFDLTLTNDESQVIDDSQIVLFDKSASRFQYYADVLYTEILTLLSGKNGIIRSDFLGKNIDFSSRAVVINDPSLAAHQIKIPKETFFKFWLVNYYWFLKQNKSDSWNRLLNDPKKSIYTPIIKSEVNINTDFTQYEHFNEFVDYFFNETSQKERLLYINRQPTLWRYGLFGVEVVGLNDRPVISVSPLIVPSLAMDFDGDTAALYRVHDHRSVDELQSNSFIMNMIEYDHNSAYLHGFSHESKYAYEILRSTNNKKSTNQEPIIIDNLYNLSYDINEDIHRLVKLKDSNQECTYGIALLNKWAKFKDIQIESTTNCDEAVKILKKNSLSNEKYHHNLKDLVVNVNWFLSTYKNETLTLPFIESCEFINRIKNNNIISKLPKNPFLGFYIYSSIVDNIYNSIPESYQLYKLTKSKFRKTAFSRSLISIGYIADDLNEISPTPVKSNILMGLTEDEFFETSYGTRKGLIDKEKNVPDAGYMQRSMVINLSSLEVIEEDCGTTYGFKIKILNKTHNYSLMNRYFIDKIDGSVKLYDETYALDDINIGKTIIFRSPITCRTADFKICRKCTGIQKFNSPYLGVMTGQYIEERLTQLTMSSFHTSGSASLTLNPKIKKFIQTHIKDIDVTHDAKILITFDVDIPNEIINDIQEEPRFKYVRIDSPTELVFDKYTEKLKNEDVGYIINKVNKILSTQTKKDLIPIDKAYEELILSLYEISDIHSVFVELLLSNCYVNKDDIVIRYALNKGGDTKIVKKYNIKILHKIQSKVLSLIFEPNTGSILNYYSNNSAEVNNPTIFEKIWNGDLHC